MIKCNVGTEYSLRLIATIKTAASVSVVCCLLTCVVPPYASATWEKRLTPTARVTHQGREGFQKASGVTFSEGRESLG